MSMKDLIEASYLSFHGYVGLQSSKIIFEEKNVANVYDCFMTLKIEMPIILKF